VQLVQQDLRGLQDLQEPQVQLVLQVLPVHQASVLSLMIRATAANLFPIFANTTSGQSTTIFTSNSKYLYKPSTGELKASVLVATNGIIVNSTTVSANVVIESGYNAHSVGPITIANGVNVLVSSGQRWLIS
jgi:hypothetical protein